MTFKGDCTSWFSRQQKSVTLSMTEADYVTVSDVMKEVLLLRQVWRLMLPDVGMQCIPAFANNEGAVSLAQNPITICNSKHIDVRHHFLRELVERKDTSVIYAVSTFQHAGFFTTTIAQFVFEFCRNFAMNLGVFYVMIFGFRVQCLL